MFRWSGRGPTIRSSHSRRRTDRQSVHRPGHGPTIEFLYPTGLKGHTDGERCLAERSVRGRVISRSAVSAAQAGGAAHRRDDPRQPRLRGERLLDAEQVGGRRCPNLWVPKTCPPHAAWAYSWISPPSRSRRATRTITAGAGDATIPSGGVCPELRDRQGPTSGEFRDRRQVAFSVAPS
jgi:hypothetical protein